MGNINTIGGRKKFTCNHNNDIKYSACLENGHWSETVNCNEDKCSPNPCENGGTCDNQEDGYYCTCTDGYEGLMCADVTVADHCYVNTIWNYSGKKNVTRSGLPCDRWDEHTGEWNIDPQYIHESSLTEAENYCRSPTPTLSWGLWCVLPGYLQWAFCDIPQC
ncbi:coagulation factor XII-like [Ruditapes philippinarum]|uniref:coagulation factor XII-like n=1 Tax=Ruditapes philippinarum TaxID=129788 RepID=UPI00295A7D8A|nr:coagulation factor XII-like [Ruditapes philippinarum]